MIKKVYSLWFVLLALVATQAFADPIGGIISYQGKLTNPDRTPISDGVYNVTFTFYQNGTNTGVTQTTPVRTFSGVFSTFLNVGAMSFDPTHTYELDVAYNGTDVKFPIASVPVAQVAKTAITANTALTANTATTATTATIAGTVSDGAITSAKIAPGAVNDSHITGVSAAKLTGQLQGSQIANGSIGDNHIAAVGANKVTGTLQPSQVSGGYVDLASAQTVGGAKTFSSPVNSSQYNIGGSRVLSLIGGLYSLAVGPGAGAASTGDYNTFVGNNAGSANAGFYNTFVGASAGIANTTGFANAFLGQTAGATNTTGSVNAFVGTGAGYSNTTGGGNAFVGYQAGYSNTTGNQNVFLGRSAGQSNTTGSNNTALGIGAGQNLTTGDNNIDIGNGGVAGEDTAIRIGTQGNQTATYIAGISGQAYTAGGGPVYVGSDGKLGTVAPSSRRFKQDIAAIGNNSHWLLHLRPVSFRYTAAFLKSDKPSARQYGLIAEEVAKVCPQMAHFDREGRPDGVLYQDLPILLLNEAQRQQRTVDAQQRTIEDLKQRLTKLETRRQ